MRFLLVVLSVLLACASSFASLPQDDSQSKKGQLRKRKGAGKVSPELASRIGRAPTLPIEQLGRPLASTRFEAPFTVPNPGASLPDVLLVYYKNYQGPSTACIADLSTGKTRQVEIPQGRNVHLMGRAVGADGNLYWALQTAGGGLEIWVHEPGTDSFGPRMRLEGGYYGQKNLLIAAPDGLLYGSVGDRKTGKAGFYVIEPARGALTDLGGLGPVIKGSPYPIAIGAEGKHVYVVYGKTPWRLIALDVKARTAKELMSGAVPLGIEQRGGSPVAVVRGAGESRSFRLKAGRATPAGKLDPERGERKRELEFDTSKADPSENADDVGILRWRRTGSSEWEEIRFNPPMFSYPISHLAALPDGRILGGNRNRGGFFTFDPATRKTQYLGRVALELHATVVVDGTVYLAGYPGGLFYEYVLGKPWTASYAARTKRAPTVKEAPDANPRMLGQLREACGIHFVTGATVGADGRPYFGGRWYRDGNGGGFAWWDPRTRAMGGESKRFVQYQVVAVTAVQGGRWIALSTLAVPDSRTRTPAPDEAKIFIFDTVKRTFVHEWTPLPGGPTTGLITSVRDSEILGLGPDAQSGNWTVYSLDARTGKVAYRKQFPATGGMPSAALGFKPGPDGQVWMLHAGGLLRISPSDGGWTVVGRPSLPGERPRKGAKITGEMLFVGKDLYLAGNESLRRIRDVIR